MFDQLGSAVQQLGGFNLNMAINERGEFDAQFVPNRQAEDRVDDTAKEANGESETPDWVNASQKAAA
jgi:hypothetical protein